MIQACGEFVHEDRLVRILEEAKELYLRRRPEKRQSFFGKMATSFNKGVRKAMSSTSLLGPDRPVVSSSLQVQGATAVVEWKQERNRARQRQPKAKGTDHGPESLAKAMMSRNEDGYGVYTFDFESVDAKDMLRNTTGSLLRKVQSC